MTPTPQAASGDKDDEITALIETVHQSMQRLEVLTAGEIDTVADGQGRTVVLQLAQEQLHRSEIERQAAILNALPAHIALLDGVGIIISVNDAWRRFADANMLVGTAIGFDYLAVCESVRGTDAFDAFQAAAGIRTVLYGTAPSFSLEYACHSPTQQRWFQMTVTPLHSEYRSGAVVMHLDISERRRAENELEAVNQKAERRERILNTTLSCISDFAYVFDRDIRFQFANKTLLNLWGLTLDEAVGQSFLELGYPQDVTKRLERDVQQVFDTKKSVTGELPYTSPSGVFGIYEYIFSPVINDGSVELVVGSSRDVTARRLATETIRIREQEQRQLAVQLEIERSRLVAAQRVAKVGSWDLEIATMSVVWSAETYRIHETDPATFQPTLQSYLELVHPADREGAEEAIQQSLSNAGPHAYEHCVSLSDGRNKVVEQRWSVIHDQNGNPVRAIGTCQDITERKEMEAARERLAAILEFTPDLVGISDPAGHILYLNRAGRAVLGFGEQEDMSKILMADFFQDPLNHPFLTTGIPTAVRDGNWRGEAVLQTRNGQAVPVSQVILAHKSPDGKLEYLSTIMRDISERIRAETAARASDAEFRNLTESMPPIVWITKADGAISYFNQHWMEYTGLTLEESLGDGWTKPFHPDDREQAWAAWRNATATIGDYSIESRLRRADGAYRWWLMRGVPQIDANGNILKWIGTCTDIHDMKEAELQISSANESLRESERRFSDLLGNVALATLMLDREARITFCNEFLLDLTGWELEEVIGKNWFELFVPADLQHLRGIFDDVIRTPPKSWHHENQIVTRSGELRLIRWNASILRSVTGEVSGLASIGEDITDKKRAEIEIQTLNATLEQRVIDRTQDIEIARNDAVTANQVKSRFLANMSHEIRTPMNGVIGIADVLYESGLSADQVEMVDLIRESGSALLTIIDDILDFSKIEAGRLQIDCAPFALADVVEKACAMLDRFAVKNGVEFTLYVDPALPPVVRGDGLRVRQVVLNLVSNAIKFSSGRDQVGKVSVQVVQKERVNGRTDVEISVRDNGIGIDEATHSRLFTAFTQADTSTTRRFGGTGLGLVISRHLVDLMGGEIALASAPGQGSTFTVRLSLACDTDGVNQVASAAPGVATVASSPIAGTCCLVIGAQGALAQHIAAYLAADGARVERALSPDHLLDRMDRLPPGPWIWIVDLVETPATMGLLDLAGKLPKHSIRLLVIGRGAQQVPQETSADVFVLDGNLLTRKRLMRAVAMVSGRMVDDAVLAPTQAPVGEDKPASRGDPLRNCRPILVAEDNEINQKVIVRQLDLLGFGSDVATSGEAALQRWKSGDYALLLTDLQMPHMDGYELAGAIRSLERAQAASKPQEAGSPTKSRFPIIALSANVLKGEADRCREAGMDDYLTKPVQLTHLKAMLETWLPSTSSDPLATGHVGSTLFDSSESAASSSTGPTPVVDVRILKKLIGTDPALLLEFLGDFQRSAAGIAQKLQRACRDNDSKAACAQAHKLKSSARSVGALALGDLCEAMEVDSKTDHFESRFLLLAEFERELTAVNSFLDSLHAQSADRRVNE